MKCPKCQSENADSRKFCCECGAKLLRKCLQCGSENLPGDKFCGECGNSLVQSSDPTPKDLSFDEKLNKIQRYLPKGLTDKILSQRDKIEGERRQVTVLFCDLEGFTPLVAQIGAEEAYGVMDQVYELLIHKVHDYEGTVNEMTGDGIMALFGAPIALEDAPQRAIRSALAIHREMGRFSDKLKEERKDIPPLKMRIGIHSGPVVVGTLGNNLRVEFKAVGDTVNLASRMEGLAEPGATYVTEDTFKLAEGLFRFEALGRKEVKGRKDWVRVYRVIAPSSRMTRFDVSAERGLTPLVGRTREIDLLSDAFERAKAGRGQAISIISEAGVGKSRLLYEFRKTVANEDVTFLEGKCLSYSKGVAYHPVADVLKANFEILEGEEDSAVKQKVESQLKRLGVDESSTLPYLLELLGVKDSGIDRMQMSPEGKKDRIIEALKRIVLKGSETRPLIMAIEDLHWIDRNSEDTLKYLLESIPGARVFLIFTYRPEFVLTWGGRSYHSQVNLNRLSNRESLAMLCHILGGGDIHEKLGDLILEKTEGVPFFIEEFVRSLRDMEVIEKIGESYHLKADLRGVTIPSTIQDVIVSRVDSLPEGARELLQIGSVIEREFSHELISQVTGLPEKDLLSHLSILKEAELLYERGVYPESTYIFKHALTREVIYDSILTPKRKRIHGEIAEAVEALWANRIEEYYGILAEHHISSGNYEKGASYSKKAARKARKDFAYGDAISYLSKEVSCLENLPMSVELQKRIIDARAALANYCLNLNCHVEAKEAVDNVESLAQELNYRKALPAIYTAIGSHTCLIEEDLDNGAEYLKKAIDIPEELGDYYSLWNSCYFLGTALCLNCEFDKGHKYLQKVSDLAVASGNPIAISLAEGTICTSVYAPRGENHLAFQESKEALRMAEKSGDIHVIGAANFFYGECCYGKGYFEEAEKCLIDAIDLCEKSDHFFFVGLSLANLARYSYLFGRYDDSETFFSKAIVNFERGKGWPSNAYVCKVGIDRAQVQINKLRIDLSNSLKNYNLVKMPYLKGWTARYIAEILLNIDSQRIAEAENWIQKAMEENRKNGLKWQLGRDYAVYGELMKRKGDPENAKHKLGKAIEILTKCGADGWVEKYQKELAAIS